MSLFFPSDIDTKFYNLFWDIDAPDADHAPTRTVTRSYNLPAPEQTIHVPVWWWSREMRHLEPKDYPGIFVQSLGVDPSTEFPNLVTQVRQFNPVDGTVTIRTAPIWFEQKWQVTVASINYQQLNELTWDIRQNVFPLTFGSRFMNLEGINREIRTTNRSFTFDAQPHVYRTTTDFLLKVPLFPDNLGAPTVNVSITELDIWLQQAGLTAQLNPTDTGEETVLKFNTDSDTATTSEFPLESESLS